MSGKAKKSSTDTKKQSKAGKEELTKAVQRYPLLFKLNLWILLFICGGSLMAMEIVGARLLSPYFGNSIFVWGAVIGLFMGALSLGYFAGGKLADKYPSNFFLSCTVVLSGILILIIPFFQPQVCSAIEEMEIDVRWAALLAATTVFALPSICLGMVSPFSVRLLAKQIQTVGSTAGSLYAVSTLGSIAGTFLCAFILIPSIGTSLIMKIVGITLIVIAVLFPVVSKLIGRTIASAVIAIILIFLVNPAEPIEIDQESEELVSFIQTPYHNITIVDKDILSQDYRPLGVQRVMKFDNYSESSIIIQNDISGNQNGPLPDGEILHGPVSRYSYTNYFHLVFLFNPDIDSALFIGGGGGIGPRMFSLYHSPENNPMRIDMVDIDPVVLDYAEEYFFIEPDDNLKMYAADGRMFVKKAIRQGISYDSIFLDAFSIGGRIPYHLLTKEYLEEVKSVLTESGAVMINLNSAFAGEDGQIFLSVYKTFYEVFSNVYIFDGGYGSDLEMSRNVLLLSTNDPENLQTEYSLKEAAKEYAGSEGPASFLITLCGFMRTDLAHEDIMNNPDSVLLTDDYCPVENMSQ